MRIWIDATDPRSALRVFGMTLLERQLHTLLEAGLELSAVYIQLAAETTHLPSLLPARLRQKLPLQWGEGAQTLADYRTGLPPDTPNSPLLVLEARAVVDSRLLRHLAGRSGSWAARGDCGPEQTAVLRLDGDVSLLNADTPGLSPPELAQKNIQHGSLQEVRLSDVPSYIRKLRRDLPVYLFRIVNPTGRDRAERFLFWSNYKGSTDFFTKYVYPPLVWRVVRPLARWRVHPNLVSLLNVGLTFLAIPLFAQGYWVTAFSLAYTMSVLDSVDGKLARLTFSASRLGDILDHGLDIIHPPLWYFAWAWALGAGTLTAPVMQLAVWMAVLYVADRIVAALFSARVGRSIHGCTRFDERMRTWISRRNINVPVFMVGLLLGFPVLTFALIVVWQAVSFGLHSLRVVQFWNREERAAR